MRKGLCGWRPTACFAGLVLLVLSTPRTLQAIPQQGTVTLTLRGGSNFVNIPVIPSGGSTLMKASELLARTGAIAVSRLAQSSPRYNPLESNAFQIYVSGFGPGSADFDIEPQKGYVLLCRPGLFTMSIQGVYPPSADFSGGRVIQTAKGLNLLGFPVGIPHMMTVEDARRVLNLQYMLRTVPDVTNPTRSRFDLRTAPAAPDYAGLQPGESFISSYGMGVGVTLPYEGDDGFGFTVTTVGQPASQDGVPWEGQPANRTALAFPEGVKAVTPDDPTLVVYSDTGNHCIRKTYRTGYADLRTKTIAGMPGRPGFSGDGGPATGALLNQPRDLTFDRFGNILFCDRGNHRVRMLAPTTDYMGGTAYNIQTVAGTTIRDPDTTVVCCDLGDGLPPTDVGVRVRYPVGVAIWRGADPLGAQDVLYVSTSGLEETRVRSLPLPSYAATARVISTYAGRNNVVSPSNQEGLTKNNVVFGRPTSLALDSKGNLYIGDAGNANVRQIRGDSGVVFTYAGTVVQGSPPLLTTQLTGQVTSNQAQFFTPAGLAFSQGSNCLFVSDASRMKIARIGGVALWTSIVAGDGSAVLSHVEPVDGQPSVASRSALTASVGARGLDLSSGEVLHFADSLHHRIRRVAGHPPN